MYYEHERERNRTIFPYGFPPRSSLPDVTDEKYKFGRDVYYNIEKRADKLRCPLFRSGHDLLKSIIFDGYGIVPGDVEKYSALYQTNLSKVSAKNNGKKWKIKPMDIVLITSMWESYVKSRGASMYVVVNRELVKNFEALADESIDKLLDAMKLSDDVSAIAWSRESTKNHAKAWSRITKDLARSRDRLLESNRLVRDRLRDHLPKIADDLSDDDA
tara:strand:- start:1644 stop:2291 length:648 start_codon:yes stop_codon:yes gene_type:complete